MSSPNQKIAEEAVRKHLFDDPDGVGSVGESYIDVSGYELNLWLEKIVASVAAALDQKDQQAREMVERVVGAVEAILPYSRSDIPENIPSENADGKGCWQLGRDQGQADAVAAARSAAANEMGEGEK